MSESEIILNDASPLGNVMAQVEDDGRVVYFYLGFLRDGQEEPEMEDVKACWVMNHGPAPDAIDEDAMDEGLAPLMPRQFCRHPNGKPALDRDALRVVWFEEGNGAALVESNEILAVIPPWWGVEGFHGYARDCTSENPIGWPLPDELHERIHKAEEYWKLWDNESLWKRYSSGLIKRLEAKLGPHSKYYAIDGGKWPPKALLRFDLPDRYVLITVGVSLLPQPNVEMATDEPSLMRRIELAAAVDKRCPVDDVKRLGSFISAQAAYPWEEWTWLGLGHTVTCDSTPNSCGGKRFPAAVLCRRLPDTPEITLPSFRGDPINLLWFFPITSAELDFAQANTSDDLIDEFINAKFDVTIRPRRELVLS